LPWVTKRIFCLNHAEVFFQFLSTLCFCVSLQCYYPLNS
jgi:hypothetical protein